MDREQDIPFLYEDGVFKPEGQVDLPNGSRGVAHISDSDTTWTVESGRRAMEQIKRLSASGSLDSGGTKLTRDQMHERR